MKQAFAVLALLIAVCGCKKHQSTPKEPGIDRIYAKNQNKVTITNGLWGTVAIKEGNCMPMPAEISTCNTYPVQRTVRVYAYTLLSQAFPESSSRIYSYFTTELIAEASTDEEGFFELEIPPGHFTVVVVEKGKLYVSGLDGTGGLSPVELSDGKVKVNLTISYAVY